MACANVLLTIAAVLSFLAVVWPGFGTATGWVVGIAAVVTVIVAWTGVHCNYCGVGPKKKGKK